jgi:hypothetical protein
MVGSERLNPRDEKRHSRLQWMITFNSPGDAQGSSLEFQLFPEKLLKARRNANIAVASEGNVSLVASTTANDENDN